MGWGDMRNLKYEENILWEASTQTLALLWFVYVNARKAVLRVALGIKKKICVKQSVFSQI